MNRTAKSSLSLVVAATLLAASVCGLGPDARKEGSFTHADMTGAGGLNPADKPMASNGYAALRVPSINDSTADQLCRGGSTSANIPFDTNC